MKLRSRSRGSQPGLLDSSLKIFLAKSIPRRKKALVLDTSKGSCRYWEKNVKILDDGKVQIVFFVFLLKHQSVFQNIEANCAGVDYSTAVVKDVLLNGIADADIKRKILGDAALASKTVQEVVTIVEAKEAARDAVATGRAAQTAASSTYKNNARSKAPSVPTANAHPAPRTAQTKNAVTAVYPNANRRSASKNGAEKRTLQPLHSTPIPYQGRRHQRLHDGDHGPPQHT